MGKGGLGGSETVNGNNRQIMFVTYTERWFTVRTLQKFWFEIVIDKPGEKIKAGEHGRDGFNNIGIEQPHTIGPPNPSITISEYKKYLLEHLENNIRESELRIFLMELPKDKYE